MYLALDIGGTKTLLAVFTENGSIAEQIKFATPKQYNDFLKIVRASAKSLKNTDFKSGAIGVRGEVNREEGLLMHDSILAWHEVPLVSDMAEIFGCNFKIENDAKTAGLSEARAHKADDKKVLYVTVSTGIGGAFITHGTINHDTHNAELGWMYFEHDGQLMKWEDFASGSAVFQKYGKRFSDIDDPDAWRDICRNLAIGLINASVELTPDLIIIGGGAGGHFATYEPYLTEAIKAIHPSGELIPKIVGAKRPDEAVIYGCYELAKQTN